MLLDYEDLAAAYNEAVDRIELLEHFALKMLSIAAGLKKVKP